MWGEGFVIDNVENENVCCCCSNTYKNIDLSIATATLTTNAIKTLYKKLKKAAALLLFSHKENQILFVYTSWDKCYFKRFILFEFLNISSHNLQTQSNDAWPLSN